MKTSRSSKSRPELSIVEWRRCRGWRGWRIADAAYKEVTNVFASDDEACIEYIARADMSSPLTDTEKREGVHGIDLKGAKPKSTFELKVTLRMERFIGRVNTGTPQRWRGNSANPTSWLKCLPFSRDFIPAATKPRIRIPQTR
jgi:hypothetical protein